MITMGDMPVFDQKSFNDMINLRFFYSQEGNLAMVAVLNAKIDDAIQARIQLASWISA